VHGLFGCREELRRRGFFERIAPEDVRRDEQADACEGIGREPREALAASATRHRVVDALEELVQLVVLAVALEERPLMILEQRAVCVEALRDGEAPVELERLLEVAHLILFQVGRRLRERVPCIRTHREDELDEIPEGLLHGSTVYRYVLRRRARSRRFRRSSFVVGGYVVTGRL
jgi:hypothetical protein